MMNIVNVLDQLEVELSGQATDKFLEFLLHGMNLGLVLSSSYRKNIENFQGAYIFRTADGRVFQAVTFDNARMTVSGLAPDEWNVRVTFKDAPALRRFLFSRDQDILNSLLANEVELDGNLNYIYKFGFMARELGRKLGVL